MSAGHVPSPEPDLAPAVEIITETTALTLATLDEDGWPRATPLFFAADDRLCLYFLSEAGSRHSQNLAREPRAAAGLFPSVSDWREIRGLQIQGTVSPLAGAEREEALALYARRFPFVADLVDAVHSSEVFRLTPSWIRLIDNRGGFAFKQEWTLP